MCTYSAALKSLQGVGGAYCLVTAGKDHSVRGGSLRGFREGDNIRVIRPKLPRMSTREGTEQRQDVENYNGTAAQGKGSVGYGLKLTFVLPEGKAVGVLKVRACWNDIVFRNEFGFTEANFLY